MPDKDVLATINRLKKKTIPLQSIVRRAPRARISVRRPQEDGIRMARQVVADFEKDLQKIN
jgi:hypothetical protein